jgi:hypothetical protein
VFFRFWGRFRVGISILRYFVMAVSYAALHRFWVLGFRFGNVTN